MRNFCVFQGSIFAIPHDDEFGIKKKILIKVTP